MNAFKMRKYRRAFYRSFGVNGPHPKVDFDLGNFFIIVLVIFVIIGAFAH